MELGIPAPGLVERRPAVLELLESARPAAARPLAPRERRVELAVAAAFLLVAAPLAIARPGGGEVDTALIASLIAAYAVTASVELDTGGGYAIATQAVFVPMLFLVAPGLAPLMVAGGWLLAKLAGVLRGHVHPQRLVLVLGNSWHAVGPAAVLCAAGAPAARWTAWPLYAAAFAAQVGVDASVNVLRERLGQGIAPAIGARVLLLAYEVDALLAPVGLLAAVAAAQSPYAFLAVVPLTGIFALFARDRRARLATEVELGNAYRGTAMLLGDVIEEDDAYTGRHTWGVVLLSLMVADELGLDDRARREVEFTALLHDVGKISIPKEIVNKPGPLDDREWALMRTHTIEGQRLLERVGGVLASVGRCVRASHERWDGAGYPDGLAGEQIPLPARIVACCDAYNAMTTDRAYRSALPPDVALAELSACAGTQFDPQVAELLAGIVSRWDPAAVPSGDAIDAGLRDLLGGVGA